MSNKRKSVICDIDGDILHNNQLIPGADIEIGSGLSENDLLEIRYRGVLSIQNAQEQLGYEPQFGDIRTGIEDYMALYRRYWAETA